VRLERGVRVRGEGGAHLAHVAGAQALQLQHKPAAAVGHETSAGAREAG